MVDATDFTRHKWRLVGLTALVVLVGDRLSKELARQVLADVPPYRAIPVVPDLVHLYLSGNDAGMLGFMTGIPPSIRLGVFLLATAIFLAYLLALVHRAKPAQADELPPLALLLAGFAGNGLDRLLYGEVIDFVVVRLPGGAAAANVADVAIFTGLGWWLLRRVRPARPTSPASST